MSLLRGLFEELDVVVCLPVTSLKDNLPCHRIAMGAHAHGAVNATGITHLGCAKLGAAESGGRWRATRKTRLVGVRLMR